MIQTSLSREAFGDRLRELERAVELRPLSGDALQQRLQHISGSTPEQVAELLDGLARGRYDNPSGWLQALRHLQATNQECTGGRGGRAPAARCGPRTARIEPRPPAA